ncbi:lipopolysaccharide export system permease protein [Fontimonas thermophila]|uniref:Lipopolysaccharide export system permease protein n=1 Tax=Fontimonas thermophila TaxID=1076937 RepID=A0A1I2IRZ1_9GAMM|nr:LPS export ABC transporter permease LptG [Fontimonas thermophila]SFF44490.1 lipopolysaccharide export system permease protein [Fontimonas thermophila]
MSLLSRYLVRTILGFTALTGFALVAIYTFISFVAEIDEVGQGGFGMLQLLWYTLMMVPSGLYALMPIIALLGTLMGLGALAAQNEINAMRASGVTLLHLGRATLAAGALLGILALVLGDWLAPAATLAARAYKTEARYAVGGSVTARPVWLRDGPHIVHIRALRSENEIADVDIYTLSPELALTQVMNVESATYGDGRWQLHGVRVTRFGDTHIQAERIDTMEWAGSLSPEVLRLFVLNANSLTTPGLLRLIAYMRDNGLDARNYRLSLWRKLVAPLTVMAMMLFAVPFVLGSQRGGGAGQRLLIGILIGLVFYVVNEVTASLGQLYGWSPALAAGLPTLLMAALAVVRLRHTR